MAERTTPGTKVAMTIAGSDPSGGAGLQADLKVFAVMGVYGCAVIAAVTSQNTTGVKHIQILDPESVDRQIAAVGDDIEVDATKTGMLGDAKNISVVAKALKRHKLTPLVVDPVMVSKSGDRLMDDEAIKALCRELLPLAAVVTPNRREAAAMLGRSDPVEDIADAMDCAKRICDQFGAKACIVTGVRRANDHEGEAVDIYYDGSETHELVSDWRPTTNLHGSGCTFSAAITASLAKGESVEVAVQSAKVVVSEAIRQATDLGKGISPVNHTACLNVK